MMRADVICVGECMVELNHHRGRYTLQFGGDTFNTAAYMSRAGARVAYATAVGDDPYSARMLAYFESEKVGTHLIPRMRGRVPGLYIIETDAAGERSFSYWRDNAPARELFEISEANGVLAAMLEAKLIYFSGITLSLYSSAALDVFESALHFARLQGARVAFDSNIRPRGWGHDMERARATFSRFIAHCDIALPTFDDEQQLWGDATPDETFARYAALGVAEVGVKMGAGGVLLSEAGERSHVAIPKIIVPVDTTAAGDSFNGGYLAARLAGASVERAALTGHALAGAVIQHKGAIVPKSTTRAALKALGHPVLR